MRNRLVHGYYDVDMDVVWATATTELTVLIGVLDGLLTPPGGP
jgi:uncharacterized protein with HEPN domain